MRSKITGRPSVGPHKKTSNWTFRIAPELRQRLTKTRSVTRIWPSELVTLLIEDYVEYVENQGEVTFPFVMVPRKEWDRLKKLEATYSPLLLEGQHQSSVGNPLA